MAHILITGATGNVGLAVIRFLYSHTSQPKLVAGVRDVAQAAAVFHAYPNLGLVRFDFENPATFEQALTGVERLFLLRPPHISDTERYFRPLLQQIKASGIQEIVFLSVQGAEKSKVIPHHKIEDLIIELGFDYIFLRPSYFMQNLTTTLAADIEHKRAIFLPAGQAKFNWIDVENIGEIGAHLLTQFEPYKNQAFELTGYENENFDTVTALINQAIEVPIVYHHISPWRFFWLKKQAGMPTGMILVMFLLHFLPRLQKEPTISRFYEQITGQQPTTLHTFIQREKDQFGGHEAHKKQKDGG